MLTAREFNRGTMQMLDGLRPYERLGMRIPSVQIVINCLDQTNDSRAIHENVRAIFDEHQDISVLETTVPDAVVFRNAASRGLPAHRLETRQPSNRTSAPALEIIRNLAIEVFPEWTDRFLALTPEAVAALVKEGADMAKPPITQARDVDAELVLQLNKFGSAADLRSQQAKLTGAAREIRKLTGGGTDLFGKLGCYLSFEQKQLLQDAARLLDSVNQQVEHAKEKRDRDEKQAKKRRELRGRLAKQLVDSNYPLPGNTLEERLEILQIALIYNRAKVFDPLYSTHQLHSKLKRWLERPKQLIGWRSEAEYFASQVGSLRCDFISHLTHEIAYDDGSEVEERLRVIKQKTAQIALTSEEQETLQLWTDALQSAPEGLI